MKLNRPPRFIDWFSPSMTWRFSVSDSCIFLTFDDGPHPDITPFVLDLLKEYGWKATFFCVGENCIRYPEIVKRIQHEGHTIGNHTMRHENGFKIKTKGYLNSFQEFEENIKTTLFRPPYGKISPKATRKISKTHKIIMWSWLSYDYNMAVSENKILENVKKIVAGDIVVLHDNPKIATRQHTLLPKLFQQIKEKGFYSISIFNENK